MVDKREMLNESVGLLVPFNVNFCKQVLVEVMGLDAEKADWRRCVLDHGEEEQSALEVRSVFPFLL
jgi:hypothetical protein